VPEVEREFRNLRYNSCMVADNINGIALYRFEHLRSQDGVSHFISGRSGGVSASPYNTLNLGYHVGDDPQGVLENRRRLAGIIGVPLDQFVFCKQVHRGDVTCASGERA
jgi:polyphenol oxidase